MNDYSRLRTQLGRVRWRWKRTQALSGLAIALVETIGIFAILLLVNCIYQPEPNVRLAASLAGLGIIVLMLVRHVIAPLVRAIPDDQLALYVEEHN
ncbi:MAG: hypothetical protein NTY19_21000, partial [Planctomycetota bacterium]|nr:hypothetical protein [Planctomycetota bacterium]